MMNKLNLSYSPLKHIIIALLLLVFVDSNSSIISLINPDHPHPLTEVNTEKESEGDFKKMEGEDDTDETLYYRAFISNKHSKVNLSNNNNLEKSLLKLLFRDISTPPPEWFD